MNSAFALGLLLALAGLAGISFGLHALLRGGRSERAGGIGPIPERSVHLIAGVRMLLVGSLSLAAGAYLLWQDWS
ncbi:MAG: hypothetical protein ACR2JR_13330 [Rubrobacteraceae bacterium]